MVQWFGFFLKLVSVVWFFDLTGLVVWLTNWFSLDKSQNHTKKVMDWPKFMCVWLIFPFLDVDTALLILQYFPVMFRVVWFSLRDVYSLQLNEQIFFPSYLFHQWIYFPIHVMSFIIQFIHTFYNRLCLEFSMPKYLVFHHSASGSRYRWYW